MFFFETRCISFWRCNCAFRQWSCVAVESQYLIMAQLRVLTEVNVNRKATKYEW